MIKLKSYRLCGWYIFRLTKRKILSPILRDAITVQMVKSIGNSCTIVYIELMTKGFAVKLTTINKKGR